MTGTAKRKTKRSALSKMAIGGHCQQNSGPPLLKRKPKVVHCLKCQVVGTAKRAEAGTPKGFKTKFSKRPMAEYTRNIEGGSAKRTECVIRERTEASTARKDRGQHSQKGQRPANPERTDASTSRKDSQHCQRGQRTAHPERTEASTSRKDRG
jgi:hypothetical protein